MDADAMRSALRDAETVARNTIEWEWPIRFETTWLPETEYEGDTLGPVWALSAYCDHPDTGQEYGIRVLASDAGPDYFPFAAWVFEDLHRSFDFTFRPERYGAAEFLARVGSGIGPRPTGADDET